MGSIPTFRIRLIARVAQPAEAAVSKTARVKVRLFPRAPRFPTGMYANGLSNLIFNQACAGSSPAIPISLRVGCSSKAERRAVNAKTTSSILAGRPRTFREARAASQASSRPNFNQESAGSNVRAPQDLHGTVAER